MKKNPNPKPKKVSDDQPNNVNDNQVAELTADLQRLQAEFINYKTRVETEKAMLSQFAKVSVVKDLLPVIDDLERALSHLPEDLTDNKWAQGTQKVYARLQAQLQKMDVSVISAIDQPFDPELHEAVSSEGNGDHQVVSEILQNGYMLGGTVIRHAVVKVANK
jgi:molecular chaperone GrpE